MNKRLLITETGGFLGFRTCEYYSNRDGCKAVGVTHRELDIEDFVAVSVFIKAIRPDYVLHCVAISNTDIRERNPVLSGKVNVRGTTNLAKACRSTDSRMILTSSDQIYSTSHSMEPNREDSEGKPGNVCGRDKKRAEEAVLTYLPGAVALRLTWMYDAPSRGRAAGRGLLQKLVGALKDGREVEFPVHDYRGITYMWEVVRHLEEAMGLPGGVHNFGNKNRCDTFDMARLLLRELAGSSSGGVLKRNGEKFASYPKNLTMDADKIKSYEIRFFNTSGGIRKYCMERREMPRTGC